MVGDEIGAAGFGGEGYGFLCPGHDGGFSVAGGGEGTGVGAWEEQFEGEGPEGVEERGKERDEED